MSEGENERMPTNLRALFILEAVGNSGSLITPTEIARELDLPKQTVHRICSRLLEEGFLAREPGRKGLRPGRRMRDLASALLQASHLHQMRHQVLMTVAQQVSETVNYVMPGEEGMHYVDRVETDWAFRVQLPIGTDVPFHCTASGKTFLASLPPKARQQMVYSLNLEALTPNTYTEPDALLRELDDVGRVGYALDREEFVEGMVAIAVPVLDSQKRFLAALAFHGPLIRLSIESAVSRLPVLQSAAKQLAELLE